MWAWSIPVGKYFGVEVRVHWTLPLLCALLITQTAKAGIEARRGVAMFAIVLVAVVLHEAARVLFSVNRARIQRMVLLPTCGVALGETADRSPEQRLSWQKEARGAMAGPTANLLVALLAGVGMAVVAQIQVFRSPYIHSDHLARSFVWMNVLLAGLNLVPAYPLALGRVLRVWMAQHPGKDTPDPWQEATRRSVAYGQGFSMLLTIMGFFAGNLWAMLIGFCVFVAAHL